MEKCAWKAYIKEGNYPEYKKRHDEIWPEMLEMFHKAGIRNYSIWNNGNELFGYYELEYGREYAQKVQAESPVANRWNEFMQDILITQDPVTGKVPHLVKAFDIE